MTQQTPEVCQTAPTTVQGQCPRCGHVDPVLSGQAGTDTGSLDDIEFLRALANVQTKTAQPTAERLRSIAARFASATSVQREPTAPVQSELMRVVAGSQRSRLTALLADIEGMEWSNMYLSVAEVRVLERSRVLARIRQELADHV